MCVSVIDLKGEEKNRSTDRCTLSLISFYICTFSHLILVYADECVTFE